MGGDFEIVTVASGARSLRSLRHGETFHPVVGPMDEARNLHVRPQRLVERAHQRTEGSLIVWDVGLGAAANALAVLEAFQDVEKIPHPVQLHSFDRTRAPLEFAFAHAAELGYLAGWEPLVSRFLRESAASAGAVEWRMHEGDFCELLDHAEIPASHAILFDPYSPASNPGLWTVEVFTQMRNRVGESACTFTSYSRSTAVRVSLLMAGWFVGRGCATGEKDETTIAATEISLLDAPLDLRWLERVRRSTAPGPLRLHADAIPPTAPEVAIALSTHPQFASRQADNFRARP